MGNIHQNQLQPNNISNKHGILQRNNIARNEVIPNGETKTKHPLSTYKDDEKRWLVTTADKEQRQKTVY